MKLLNEDLMGYILRKAKDEARITRPHHEGEAFNAAKIAFLEGLNAAKEMCSAELKADNTAAEKRGIEIVRQTIMAAIEKEKS